MDELYIPAEKTISFLKDFLYGAIRGAGFEKAVVGLSGGVDSSLACTLAVKALGPSGVNALFMPYRTSHPDSRRHAFLLAKQLDLSLTEIDISPQVDAYFRAYPDADAVRRGNKMARERMSVLYDQSALFQGLVVGTSNRTEILLGYGTLFGDTACALNPLGGLYKTQVFALARAAGVPEEIVRKPPSADLWKGQTDEDELGFIYEQVDRLLHHMFDRNRSDAELEELSFPREFIEKVRNRVRRFAYKGRPPEIARLPEDLLVP
jgi:NAD+ synthase